MPGAAQTPVRAPAPAASRQWEAVPPSPAAYQYQQAGYNNSQPSELQRIINETNALGNYTQQAIMQAGQALAQGNFSVAVNITVEAAEQVEKAINETIAEMFNVTETFNITTLLGQSTSASPSHNLLQHHHYWIITRFSCLHLGSSHVYILHYYTFLLPPEG
jgi:hypothetical protein